MSARTTATREAESGRPTSSTGGCIELHRKEVFVKPQLICHGAVVDLTNQFGGSLTPEERQEQGFE